MPKRRDWTRGETLAAFALYFCLPSNQQVKTNKDVIALSEALGRSPGSVSMKLANLKANDPMRKGVGLKNGSHLDAEIWHEYDARGNDLMNEAVTQLDARMGGINDKGESVSYLFMSEPEGRDRIVEATVRVNQSYFRNSLMENYGHHCCFTGMGMDKLLVASHIKPWAASNAREKVSPDNGLLLNALHDRAFDQGLMTIDENMRIRVSPKVPKDGPRSEWLWGFDKQEMRLPTRMRPRKDFIEYHNDVIFQR